MVLANARVIDGTGRAPLERAYVQIEGVREQLRRGADFVKLMATGARSVLAEDPEPAQMTPEQIGAIVDGGLSPLEGIAAATLGSARALGLPDVGTVTAGAVADLLVIDGDPVSDVEMLRDAERISMVVQAGRVVGGRARLREPAPA
jgi:imidazolonepropionase-like amidohydrolase